jgi:D-cysteine desulfhydrase
MATALATLMSLPLVPLVRHATNIEPMDRLQAALGPDCPTLLIKRDDLLGFAMGGNKVRKMQAVAAEARAQRADVLITCGGVQSNHARVTAATGAVLGMRVVLVVNGEPPDRRPATPCSIASGADVCYVASRDAARR